MTTTDSEQAKRGNLTTATLGISRNELSCKSEEILPDSNGDKQKPKDAEKLPSHKTISNVDKKSLRKLSDNENDQPQSNLHVRYWTYLFDNLHRSIDEIFCACESEENISGCHEALRTMEVYQRDFEELIKRIKTQEAFECTTADQGSKPPLVWEVRASPPRTNCPVTLLLHNEEPRTVSPLTKKKRNPKRCIDFKDDKQAETSTADSNGTASWADMVRNGHRRLSQSNSGASSPSLSQRNTENGAKKENKERSSKEPSGYRYKSDSMSKDSKENSITDLSRKTSSSSDTYQYVTSNTNSKLSDETAHHSTTNQNSRKSSADSDKNLTTDISFLEEDNTREHPEDDDEGWEVVSRGRGKPLRKGYTRVHPTEQPSDKNLKKKSEYVDLDDSEIVVDQVDNQFDYDVNDFDGDWQYHTSVAMEIGDPDGKHSFLYNDNLNNSPGTTDSSRTDEPIRTDIVLSDNSSEVGDPDLTSAGAGNSTLSQSWPERSSTFLEAYNTRQTTPAYQKLMSPQRRKPSAESKRILDEKLGKTRLQRDKVQGDEDVTEQRRALIEEKLQRAEMKRVSLLQEKVKKAQEEEAKLNEIAFINTLEAQNKKIEVLSRHQGHEARLQDIQEERQRKKEEQQAKEEAAQERRRTLEAERLAKRLELDQKRKENDARVEQLILEREKAREEAAKEKARERERKLEARNEAITLSIAELEKKIQLKQDKSSKRYDMQLEQRKGKAAVASRHVSPEDAPRVTPYERKKWCSVCSVKIVSELYLLSHLRGKKHQEAVAFLPTEQSDPALLISDISEEQIKDEITMEIAIAERMKAGKKRGKKIKQRVSARAKDYESTPHPVKQNYQSKLRPRFQKLLRDINKMVESNGSNIWDSANIQHLDRILGELKRSFSPQLGDDQLLFCHLGGIDTLVSLLLLYTTESSAKCVPVPYKSFRLVSIAVGLACAGNLYNSRHFVLSGRFIAIIDLLSHHLSSQIPNACRLSSSWGGDGTKSITISDQLQYICGPLLSLIARVVATVAQSKLEPIMEQALHDFVGYIVCNGLIDQLYAYFSVVYGPVDDCQRAQLVLDMLNVLVATTALFHYKVKDVFSDKLLDDPTQLIDAMQRTELVGIASLLYAILLHSGPPRHSTVPPALSTYTTSVTTAAVKCINNAALMNIKWFQHSLGAEGISLQFRHTASYLLWHCSHHSNEVLLHEVILVIGYFCVLNPDNQVFLQSGRSPTVLQLLCALPLDYFTTPRLVNLLFPTFVSICYKNVANMAILSKEIDCQLLCKYIQEQIDSSKERELKCLSDLQYRFPIEHWQNALQFFQTAHHS